MTSHKQIIANRGNALKSTGPRTDEGKAIVCQNAIKHGILSQEVPIDEKESISFEEFSSSLFIQLNPIGDFEHFIVDRIISSAWRLRRIIHIETEFYRSELNSQFSFQGDPSIKDAFSGSAKDRMAVLSRYETTIEKSLYKALAELMRLQAMRQGLNINPQLTDPAQVRRLTEYADKKQLSVIQVCQITESSTKESRKEFEKIIDLIAKSKEPIVLIADTVDRVQRGFKESILIEKLLREGKMELHFLRDRLILDKNSNSTDVMRWDMSVMFAKAYVLQLSDNVKRSLEQSRKEGIRANLAPLGYLNVVDKQGNKDIIPDPDQRHLIVKLFELYITGNHSYRQITEMMKEMGLKNKQGGHVSHSKIADALKDPFYYGVMKAKGELYPHKHEPIISHGLFQKAQEVRMEHNKKPFQYAAKPFIFRGMITCGNCGCLVSPEVKKGKYVYYSCTNAKGICQWDYINEKEFLKEISYYFDEISLSQEVIQQITQYLKDIYESEGFFYQEQKNRLRKEQDQIQQRLSKMYDDRYDGKIDETFFQKKLKEYKDWEFAIIQEMDSHAKVDESFYVTANMVLSLARRSREIFESSEVDEKRKLLNFVFQNLELKDKKLSVTLREPFKIIKNTSRLEKCPRICPR